MKNIVVIGGGTGTSLVLQGLKKYPVHLSAVVSTADDGGSTGRLREQLGGVPVGDIRACLLALSNALPIVKEQMAHRWENGHVAMNVALAQYQDRYGIQAAISHFVRFLKVKGEVIPVTLKGTKLSAVLQNGQMIRGEHNINLHEKSVKISKIKLSPSKANPAALRAIKKANLIVFAPGDIYTSILPNVLVPGIAKAIARSSAKKVIVVNFLRQKGHTDRFQVVDFVELLEEYLHSPIDIAIVNTEKPKIEKNNFVEPKIDPLLKRGVQVITSPLLSQTLIKQSKADKLKRSKILHDPKKLGKIIYKLVN